MARSLFEQTSAMRPLALHPAAKTLLGKDNLAFLNGPDHRELRKPLLRLMSPKSLEGYLKIQEKIIRESLVSLNAINSACLTR
jgi:cytochrome P450 family 710 subfamily A protein